MLLTRKTDSAPTLRSPHAETRRDQDLDDGSAHVPQALRPCRGRRRVREPVAVWRDRTRRSGQGRRRDQGRDEAHDLHALLGRLLGRRHRRQRRVDAAGAGVRIADQSRRALRQGRVGPRARRHRAFAPAEDADEARQRQVAAHLVGPGAERGRRQDSRHQEGIRSGRHLLGRQFQAQQRAGVPDAQVRVVLRHEQLRPPGADLPLDDGRRRSQHVGLRRDDQLVQRHAVHQVRDVHRQQRGRGAPGVDAAHAAREGNRREDDRRRSALHADGGQGRRVRAHPLRHRYPVRVRDALSHLQERLGRPAVHQRPRLRDGEGQGGSARQVDARQGRGSLRRARGDGLQDGRNDGQEQAVDDRLVHGPDAAHDRQRDRPCVLHPATGARQRRQVRRRHEHLPRPRQRAGRDRRRPEPRFAARLLRIGHGFLEVLGRRLGRRLRVDQEAVRRRHDGKAGHHGVAVDRRRHVSERRDRPGSRTCARWCTGAMRRTARPAARTWSRR